MVQWVFFLFPAHQLSIDPPGLYPSRQTIRRRRASFAKCPHSLAMPFGKDPLSTGLTVEHGKHPKSHSIRRFRQSSSVYRSRGRGVFFQKLCRTGFQKLLVYPGSLSCLADVLFRLGIDGPQQRKNTMAQTIAGISLFLIGWVTAIGYVVFRQIFFDLFPGGRQKRTDQIPFRCRDSSQTSGPRPPAQMKQNGLHIVHLMMAGGDFPATGFPGHPAEKGIAQRPGPFLCAAAFPAAIFQGVSLFDPKGDLPLPAECFC